MNYADLVEKLLQGESLTETEAGEAVSLIMRGELQPTQIAALLTALRAKGETVDEIVGSARAMRAHAVPVKPNVDALIDTCGTGGDHSGSFNISTTAAFVVAGAGVPVAKHGNRSATSRCGSIDLLEALGVNVNLGPDGIAACIERAGIGVLFARVVHPAMKHAAPVRSELGFRTIFNFLGPLTNPATPGFQLVGISGERYLEVYAACLQRLGAQRAWVATGSDGMDELTPAGVCTVIEATPNTLTRFDIRAEDAGLAVCSAQELNGGDAGENAAITRAILGGESRGAKRDAVLLNAGAALLISGKANTLREGAERAADSIDSGRAKAALEKLNEVSNEMA